MELQWVVEGGVPIPDGLTVLFSHADNNSATVLEDLHIATQTASTPPQPPKKNILSAPKAAYVVNVIKKENAKNLKLLPFLLYKMMLA